MTFVIVGLMFIIVSLLFIIKGFMKYKRWNWKRKHNISYSVGFFHPYCNAGGGGERVLWCAVRAVQERYKNIHCVIYTGDDVPRNEILEKVEKRFNIKLPNEIEFIYLKQRTFVEAKHYPYFTLLLQSLGSVILGFEAAFKHVPDVYIDTMGYAWTYPIFNYLCSCRIAAYVHYPTISTDMIDFVLDQNISVTNRENIAQSKFYTFLKVIYYKLFALFYGLVGRNAEVIMVNSTWTRNHILKLWGKPNNTFIVYPPCDVSEFEKITLKNDIDKENLRIISIAQFRPEKNHEHQLNAFQTFLKRLPSDKKSCVLVLIGSCRHDEDYKRVEKLKALSSELNIEENVIFKINLTFDEIINEMKLADIALHTMWNEHFGIGVVECMSAGLITIAHSSGGPKSDIILAGRSGLLATTVESYASTLMLVWNMDSKKIHEMRTTARESVKRFSTKKFENAFLDAMGSMLEYKKWNKYL